ncbi:hypothetical protein GSI_00858 [Ganoderma sinense ZZ0214-1]|uniref:Uncharacterized protein n=1 Tax=Ganoderma sinense ZZ0214-1 TaxID=1077348 RepID=A0A2G8STR0_9APHY|nr:hypothetical protein GSI_00858 [Ganoderma sinense ZZ0214-1]
MSEPSAQEPAPEFSPATDYGSFAVDVLARMTRTSGRIDQMVLRRCLGLASSYLVSDVTMNAEEGVRSWRAGFNRLVDVMVALHMRQELEVETVNAASQACSECWSVAGSWREMDECREGVKAIATRLKGLLDANGKTFRGQAIYAP